MKTNTQTHDTATSQIDEHELLQQDDFRWLADFKDTLSPYWAARVQYEAAKSPVIIIQGLRNRSHAS